MSKFVYIINALYFSVSLAFLIFEIWQVAWLLITIGFSYNVWCFLKYSDSHTINHDKFSEGLDRETIMEDLDREAQRRREVEKLNRN